MAVAPKNAGPLRRIQSRKAKRSPAPRSLKTSQGVITLEEVLVGIQRSLARATRSSLETARGDWQVGLGQRALYVIDSIGVTMNADLVMVSDPQGCIQAASLNLQPEGGNTTLEFRVQARPIEAISEEQLLLADLDPLGLSLPRHSMRLTLVGRDGGEAPSARPAQMPMRVPSTHPKSAAAATQHKKDPPPVPSGPPPLKLLAGREVKVFIVGGDTGHGETFVAKTNAVGQVDIMVDASTNHAESGSSRWNFARLDLLGDDDDFFVHATCTAQGAKGDLNLVSNVLQFSVKRQAAPSRSKKT